MQEDHSREIQQLQQKLHETESELIQAERQINNLSSMTSSMTSSMMSSSQAARAKSPVTVANVSRSSPVVTKDVVMETVADPRKTERPSVEVCLLIFIYSVTLFIVTKDNNILKFLNDGICFCII
jgi:hypothetical protein